MMRESMIRELIKETGMRPDQAEWEINDILRVLDQIGYAAVTKKRLRDLRNDSDLLIALQNAGVDNWEGWYDVIQRVGDH